MRRLLALVCVLLTMLLAGCTTVPSSSSPETVEPIDLGVTGQAELPPVDAGPRPLVVDFLDANAANSATHAAARGYLTPAARKLWSDQTVTIIGDRTVGNYIAAKGTLTVTGRVIGTLNADGIYVPTLAGTGSGDAKVPFVYGLSKVRGQYRIDPKRNGLLITADQFAKNYQQHVVYFYDLAERTLVPDVRWSALPATDRASVARWLLDQLIAGPRPELQSVLSTDTLPAQADARGITVKLGSLTEVEIPGSGQLDPDVRNRLAAQIAHTLDEPLSGGAMSITDSGTPIDVPAAGGTTFTAATFPAATGPAPAGPSVYYLSGGRVIDDAGKPLAGPLGDGSNTLSSIALARPVDIGVLTIAGVEGTGPDARLFVGTQSGGLHRTSVQGTLSHPAWAPGRAEIWIGVGSKVERVTTNGRTSHPSTVSISPTAGGGRIVALRLSPDGSRIALVISGAGPGSAQLYVGSVVRGAGEVHVTGLQPISPQKVVITDVGWNSPLKLFAIGYFTTSLEARVFETGVDGSLWSSRDLGSLPAPPDSLTVAPYGVWVSADGTVWQFSGGDWVSPGVSGQTPGTDPVYLG